jgi:UDP-glucose 4-epimerase
VFNLGNGNGFSVKEVIGKAEKVTELKVPHEEVERRAGDPARLVADSGKARKILSWNPSRQKLEDIISSAWRWHSKRPDGY